MAQWEGGCRGTGRDAMREVCTVAPKWAGSVGAAKSLHAVGARGRYAVWEVRSRMH